MRIEKTKPVTGCEFKRQGHGREVDRAGDDEIK